MPADFPARLRRRNMTSNRITASKIAEATPAPTPTVVPEELDEPTAVLLPALGLLVGRIVVVVVILVVVVVVVGLVVVVVVGSVANEQLVSAVCVMLNVPPLLGVYWQTNALGAIV
jgi:hypothetical protein